MNEPLPEIVTESSLPAYKPAPKAGPHDLLINVLGTSFSITAGEAPEYLEEVLAQYRTAVANTQGISGMKDPLKVAILTGFLLCDEINKIKQQIEEDQDNAREQHAGEARELSRITQNLIACIDQVMEKSNLPDD